VVRVIRFIRGATFGTGHESELTIHNEASRAIARRANFSHAPNNTQKHL
jgi:hypothetical protein